MAGMTSLAIALKTAWTLWDVDGELTGVEEQGRVVGNVELLFLAQKLVALLCDAVDQTAANSTRQLEVFSLRNLYLVARAYFQFGSGGFVAILLMLVLRMVFVAKKSGLLVTPSDQHRAALEHG
jgi:hypothetical protein